MILYVVIFVSIIVFSMLIPAYAEVTSLKTNSPFYKGGNKIYFSGTILNSDASTVTILIFRPDNQYALIASGIANNTHQFQIMVDTSIQENQQKLSSKGIYNATAFVAHKENGKTVSFAFSPDGSPITVSPPILVATVRSSTEIDLSWSNGENNGGTTISGYKIERSDGNNFNTIQNTQITSYQDLGLVPNQQYSYRVSAINSVGITSDPSNVVSAATMAPQNVPPPNPTSDGSTAPSLDELLKQRMKDAQKLQELLHGSNPSGSTQSPQPGVQHTISLNEQLNLNDAYNVIPKKSVSENNLSQGTFPNFEIKNIMYPLISIVGVAIVVTVLYLRKKQKTISNGTMGVDTSSVKPIASDTEDYPILIIKNRLAKGEITMDEFKLLKDELSES